MGGNLPVEEQIRKKFKSSPAWVLNMAVEMRQDLNGDDEGDKEGENEKEPVGVNGGGRGGREEKEEAAEGAEGVEGVEGVDLEEDLNGATMTMAENRKLKRQRKQNKKGQSSCPTVSGGLTVLLPKDEELESSADEADGSSSSEEEENDTKMKNRARPVSRQDMKNRALLVVKRRQEIQNFLGTNSAKQRENRR